LLRGDEVAGNLEVKQVIVKERRRYIVCRNPEERPVKTRQLVKHFWENWRRPWLGTQGHPGQSRFCPFLQVKKETAQIDPETVRADARLDRRFVLSTSTQLSAEEEVESYKSLWRVEGTFR
jgi:hypothetical protein